MEGLRTLKQFGIEVPEAEYAPPGHTACAGCPGAAMMRQILKLLGPKVVLTNPASCPGEISRAASRVGQHYLGPKKLEHLTQHRRPKASGTGSMSRGSILCLGDLHPKLF